MRFRRWLAASAAVSMLATIVGAAVLAPTAQAAAVPHVTNLNTASGDTFGHVYVTITGSGFTKSSVVTFGAVRSSSVLVHSSTRINALAPNHSPATVYVHVRTAAGISARSVSSRYVYVVPPETPVLGRSLSVLAQGHITDLACVSSAFCAAVDDLGGASIYNGTWHHDAAVDRGKVLNSVSCPTKTACTAVDDHGRVARFNGTRWSSPKGIDAGHSLVSVSCPTAGFCMAVDSSGDITAYSNGHWHTPNHRLPHGTAAAVSCSSNTFCMATGSSGQFYPTDVIRYTGSWGTAHAINSEYPFTDVSCASSRFCAAGQFDDNFATFDTYAGDSWNRYGGGALNGTTDAAGVAAVSCVTARFCAMVYDTDDGPAVGITDGTADSDALVKDGFLPTDVSCWAVRQCMIITDGTHAAPIH